MKHLFAPVVSGESLAIFGPVMQIDKAHAGGQRGRLCLPTAKSRRASLRLLRPVDGKLCYTLTPFGRRVALFLTKLHARVLRPGLQALDLQITAQVPPPLRLAFTALDAATEALIKEARLAA